MNKLKNKTFWTIFTIISSFFILAIVIFNIQNYQREYFNVKNYLTMKNTFIKKNNKQNPFELDNIFIAEYEVYTVNIKDNEITKIISHSNESNDFEIEKIANKIINNNSKDKIKIGNLFVSKYAYNYKQNNSITIINTKHVSESLFNVMIMSLILISVIEVLIFIIAKNITIWITKPALDSFNKQKDFIADASHELKTPLAVIIASSDELKEDKKNKKYIENIKYESERMNKLISSLLDLSTIESGTTKDSFKEENISKITEKTCLIFESIAYEQEINIDTNIEKNIMFKCNKDEIERVISIIIDNAIKHSTKSSTIKVNMSKIKNTINLEIINNGEGIIEGEEEKIFERFYRGDKSRNRSENRYGLGLAIAKNIVINHNGNIEAFSKNGLTTFKISFKNK